MDGLFFKTTNERSGAFYKDDLLELAKLLKKALGLAKRLASDD